MLYSLTFLGTLLGITASLNITLTILPLSLHYVIVGMKLFQPTG